MGKAKLMITEYIGAIDGVHTWIVKNEQGEIIGKNETPEIIEPDSDRI